MPSEAELERLVVRVNGDASGYKRTMEDVRSQTNLTDGHIQLATRRISAFGLQLRGYGASAAALILPIVHVAGAIGAAWKGINLASEFEKNEQAFGTMLQSVDKGKKLMEQIATLAAETPLNQRDLQQGAKMLLQFGESADKVVNTLRMLGDVSGGDSQKLQRLALAYGQVRGVGHVQGDELNQMLEAGFNPLREMARVKAGPGADENQIKAKLSELTKLKEQGGITFGMLEEAFRTATTEGGGFFNGMKNQAGTLSGLFSTMEDDIDTALRGLGQSLIQNLNLKGFVAEISAGAQRVTEWFKGLDPVIMQAAVAIGAATVAFVVLTAAIVVAGVAFNVAFGGIGYTTGLIITTVGAIIALTAGWIVSVGSLATAWDQVKEAARAAWDWTQPIREVLVSLGKTIVGGLVAAWDAVKNAAVRAWASIVGDASVNWDQVREIVRESILWIEYSLTHIEQVADFVWKAVKYGAVSTFETVKYYLLDVLPAAVDWFGENAETILTELYNWWAEATLITTRNVVNVFKAIPWDDVFELVRVGWEKVLSGMVETSRSLPKLISGALKFADIWGKDAKAGTDAVKVEMEKIPGMTKGVAAKIPPFVPPERVIGDLEKRQKEEMDRAKATMKEGFAEFKKMKEEQFQRDKELALVPTAGQLALIGIAVTMGQVSAGANAAAAAVTKVKDSLASFSGQSLVGSAADKRNLQDALTASVEARGIRIPDPFTVNPRPGLGAANPVAGPERAVQILDQMLGIMKDGQRNGVAMMPANIGGVN